MENPETLQHLADGAAKVAKASGVAAAGSPLIAWSVQNYQLVMICFGAIGTVVTVASFIMSQYWNKKRTEIMMLQGVGSKK